MADEYTPTTEQVREAASLNGAVAVEPDAFNRWLAGHDAEVREQALAPIRAALANHPRCDIHPDDDPIKCGWKRAVADIQAVLDRQEQP